MLKLRKARSSKNSAIDMKKMVTFKTMVCSKGCGQAVEVDSSVESVICWYCVSHMVAPPEIRAVQHPTNGIRKAKGWHFMKVYVDAEGNVFHEGVEQPKLKGTLPQTPIKPKKNKGSKTSGRREKRKKTFKTVRKKAAIEREAKWSQTKQHGHKYYIKAVL